MYRRNASETSADRNLPIKIVLLDGSTLSIRRPAGYFYGKLIDGRVAFSAVSDFIPRSRKYLVYDLVGGSHWGSTRGSAIAAAIAAESSTPRSNPTNRWGVTFKKGDIVQYQGANYRYWKLDKADDFSRAYGRQAVLTYALSGPFLADDTREAGIGDLTKPRSNPRVNKYEYLLVLQGHYGQGWEDLTAVEKKGSGFDGDAKRAIKALLKNYRDNEPGTALRVINRKEVR